MGETGPTLIESPEAVVYENPYPTPSPTPEPTPTPTPTPTPEPTVMVISDSPSATPQEQNAGINGFLGASVATTLILLGVILLLIVVVAVLLVVILRNKNIKGKE